MKRGVGWGFLFFFGPEVRKPGVLRGRGNFLWGEERTVPRGAQKKRDKKAAPTRW